ncbi:hypothetical protein ACFL3G_01870 [Planctomycetota bacterium]
MKTYLSQIYWKKLLVVILLSFVLVSVVKAGEQSGCGTCATQRTMQISQSNEISDSAGPAAAIDNGRARLSDKELIEEYRASIEGKIIGIISDMMAIFVTLSLLLLFIQFIIR